MGTEYGPWDPLTLAEAYELFVPAPFRWWVAGGHALELHLGRSWRPHDDIDISFRREDSPLVRAFLADWDVQRAAAGVLTPWMGDPLVADLHHNNLWCKRTPERPWCLDLTVADGDDDRWIFRRDQSISVPWADAILTSSSGIPYLAPELQLLFKARDPRPKDDLDAAETIATLEHPRAAFLSAALPEDHPWRKLLGALGGDLGGD